MQILKLNIYHNFAYVGTTYDIEIIEEIMMGYSVSEHCDEVSLAFQDTDDGENAFGKFMLEYGETIEDTQADRGVKK